MLALNSKLMMRKLTQARSIIIMARPAAWSRRSFSTQIQKRDENTKVDFDSNINMLGKCAVLDDRRVLSLKGDGVTEFLQDLITNDMTMFDDPDHKDNQFRNEIDRENKEQYEIGKRVALYTCLLNAKGRI